MGLIFPGADIPSREILGKCPISLFYLKEKIAKFRKMSQFVTYIYLYMKYIELIKVNYIFTHITLDIALSSYNKGLYK